jgi:molybdopterin-containing oxidoreductase family iron-sulfur binding subunit
MRPVFNTRQTGDVLISVANQLGQDIAGGANSFYDYLRAQWGGRTGGEQGWRDTVVAGGMFPGVSLDSPDASALPLEVQGAPGAPPQTEPGVVAVAPGAVAPVAATPPRFDPVQFEGAEDASFNLVVYPSYRFFDGRTANRPWLLELPDPVTKVSWQSWVEMHPQAARELDLEQGDVVEVVSPFGRVAAPVYLYAGVRPDTVAIQTGLGHRAFGRYTEGRGVNPNVLLGTAADARTGAPAPYGVRVAVRPAGAVDLAGPPLFEQGVRVQHDREIAQAISLAQLARATEAGHPAIPGENSQITTLRGNGGFAPVTSDTDPASYPPAGTKYGQYVEGTTRWAMTVDLSRCTGCSACVTACYAENNIPVVGPDEVRKGRELSWLRIERYFGVEREGAEEYRQTSTDTDDVRFLPMMCQQCGNAPCEPVCPVYAAYHTPDGLNGQVYNRCVGTRYCANNCPYKVRYFNWFTYEFPAPLNWQLNPDVTVREKGVMEKCTFCVQRIREVERDAAREDRTPRDGEITPACVQTCPTQVFVFGNIADPDSEVARAARSVRSYRSLEPLNTQPGVVYLKKVTLHEPAQGGHHAPETAEAELH